MQVLCFEKLTTSRDVARLIGLCVVIQLFVYRSKLSQGIGDWWVVYSLLKPLIQVRTDNKTLATIKSRMFLEMNED